jgi:hypothetical protein
MEEEELASHMIRCLSCNFKTSNKDNFLLHARKHQYEPNFRLPCYTCPQRLQTFKSHKKHLKICGKISKPRRDNKRARKIENLSHWQCPICADEIEIDATANIYDFNVITKHCFSHAKKEAMACPVCNSSYTVK